MSDGMHRSPGGWQEWDDGYNKGPGLGGSPCLYLGCDPMKNPTFNLWLVPSVVPTVLSMGIFKQPDTSMHSLSALHAHCTDAWLAPTGDPLSHLWP